MYFDIVLVYHHQREKRTPPRPTTRQQQGRRGGGQVMQLSLHDMTGQSWVSHVGPSFSVFYWGGGTEIQGQCDQGLPRWQSWQCSLLTESEEFVALLLAGCLSGGQILLKSATQWPVPMIVRPAVLLMTESRAEVNAGLVIVTGHVPVCPPDVSMEPQDEQKADQDTSTGKTDDPSGVDPRLGNIRRMGPRDKLFPSSVRTTATKSTLDASLQRDKRKDSHH